MHYEVHDIASMPASVASPEAAVLRPMEPAIPPAIGSRRFDPSVSSCTIQQFAGGNSNNLHERSMDLVLKLVVRLSRSNARVIGQHVAEIVNRRKLEDQILLSHRWWRGMWPSRSHLHGPVTSAAHCRSQTAHI